MKLKVYQADAFTDKVFGGNPACVCPLEKWTDEETMQNIAAENNLSETAFFVREGGHYKIRWFTPTVEVDLCGHATLASGHVLFNHLGYRENEIHFQTVKRGELIVKKEGDKIVMDFPITKFNETLAPKELVEGIRTEPIETHLGGKFMVLLNSEEDVKNVRPDYEKLGKLNAIGVIVTAKGIDVDFVSRFFAPRMGINEDPVTGSAHTLLIPYWAEKLGKNKLTALQLSKRVGKLWCDLLNNRVEIKGKVVTYLEGNIFI